MSRLHRLISISRAIELELKSHLPRKNFAEHDPIAHKAVQRELESGGLILLEDEVT